MSASIVDRIIKNFINQPDKVAIRQHGVEKTYGQLQATSNAVASYLISNGLQKGERVALFVENSFDYISIYYGVLISGGVVVPLNTSAKAIDLTHWINHSGSKWLFSTGKNSELREVASTLYDQIRYVVIGEHSIASNINIDAFDEVLSYGMIESYPVLEG
ncbi:MAG: acyl--CoA ligase, partial [Gammaproteobacteria bacterium]|nr:acyl--CoA ligase [Gammaproteobacteria bacterium]